MTKEEYIAKMNEDREWAPGWDVIEKEFSRLYPGQEPKYYGTNMASRAIFGGDNYLDGYSVYKNPAGYMHIVTFGMSELYTDPDAFGGEYSHASGMLSRSGSTRIGANTSAHVSFVLMGLKCWAFGLSPSHRFATSNCRAYARHSPFVELVSNGPHTLTSTSYGADLPSAIQTQFDPPLCCASCISTPNRSRKSSATPFATFTKFDGPFIR